ncbi:MAG: DUF748 domain-containing protein [Porticoccaceae bacterium]
MAETFATLWQRAHQLLWRQRSKLQRWGIVLASLFILYLLLGFLLVPVIVKQQLIAQLGKATGRDVAVEAVKFDPLRLALTVNGLNLKEENGESFAGWDSLYVNFEASSLVKRALTFADIHLVRPRVQIRRFSAGRFNFTPLLGGTALGGTTPSPATPEPGPKSALLPAILIQQLSISDGGLVYRDDTHADAPVLKYLPINFSVKAFSTRAEQNAPAQAELTIKGEGGEQLHWQGDLSLPVLASSGRIEASGFDLAGLSRFAAEALPFRLVRGKLDAHVDYRLATTTDPAGSALRVNLSGGALTLGDLALADKATPGATPIEIAGVQVDGIGLDSSARTIDIAQVVVSGGKIAGTLAPDGQLDLLKLFAAASVAPGSAPPDPQPWLTTLAKASLDGFRVQLTDQGPSPPVVLALDPLRVTLENFRSDNSQPVQLAIDGDVNDGGRLRVSGPVSLAPVQATLKIEAEKISLAGFQPYLSRFINIQLHSGVASTVGTLTYPEAGQGSGLSYRGDAGIENLNTTDNRFNREFLSWKQLAVKDLHFQQTANRIAIDSVEFNRLYGRFAIRADGTTNVEKLLVTAPESSRATAPATPEVPSPPMAIVIKRVTVTDSAAYFADLTMTPDFRVGIFNLKGGVKGVDSGSGEPIAIDLHGQVDRYAPVTIKGKVNPFKATPTLDMKLAFKNLEMTTLTPYSGVYAGHRIKQGQLSVDLHYQLENNQIVGHNHIVMNQMELGERVKSAKATDLPLRLALALLKDSKGVIDLGLEVKGNINEPNFSVGGLVFKAFKNLIVKVVSAPFNLIAGLVGGGEDNGSLDAIAFAPGSAQLDAREKAKLDQLAKALAARPQLRLEVAGNSLPGEDTQALAQRRLEHQLAALFNSGSADGDQSWPGLSSAVANKKFRRKLYALYESTTGESAKTRRGIIGDALSDGGKKPTDAEIDSALHEHIQHELLAREEVPEKALAELARQRALAVKAYLADSGGLTPERVFVVSDGAAGQPALSARLTLNAL